MLMTVLASLLVVQAPTPSATALNSCLATVASRSGNLAWSAYDTERRTRCARQIAAVTAAGGSADALLAVDQRAYEQRHAH